jgi:glycerol kinase
MAGPPYILALDQGTTSSRAIVCDRVGRVLAVAREAIAQARISPLPPRDLSAGEHEVQSL